MSTDTEIKVKGVSILTEALGEVDAERFIALILREPFDYTRWQERHFSEKESVEEISRRAKAYRESSLKP